MTIKTDQELPAVASKSYPLLLKHHKFISEESENLLVAWLIKRSMSPYAIPIIVVPGKSKPGAPLAKTKRLVVDYQELNKQVPKVYMTQAKSKGSKDLTKAAKVDNI